MIRYVVLDIAGDTVKSIHNVPFEVELPINEDEYYVIQGFEEYPFDIINNVYVFTGLGFDVHYNGRHTIMTNPMPEEY